MAKTERKCDVCGRIYVADTRDLKRGWGDMDLGIHD